VLDGSTGEDRRTYAIYNTPPCWANQSSEARDIVLPACDCSDAHVEVCCRVSTPADPQSDDMYLGIAYKTTPEANRYRRAIQKYFNGTKTTLVWQPTSTAPTSVKLAVSGTDLDLYWNDVNTDNKSDSDISATGYVGFALRIQTQTGSIKISEWLATSEAS